jgi:hypothetical protein
MRIARTLLSHRFTSESFDCHVGLAVAFLGGLAMIPMAFIALMKHPGTRLDFLIGLALACLVGLLLVKLGTLARRIVVSAGNIPAKSRWPEHASYVGCIGLMIAGMRWLPPLGLSPVQVTLGVLLVCSLSLAVLVLGMMSTLVRSRTMKG